MANRIKRHMRNLLLDGCCVDSLTGGANLTELAESTAHALGHDEWLDDECHAVWEHAVTVAEKLGMVV